MKSILLLNGNWEPHDLISWRKAFSLIKRGKVEQVSEEYITIRCPSQDILIPKTIRLTNMISNIYKQDVKYNKQSIFMRDNYTCGYCGKHISKPTIDHVLPKSLGGKDTFENTVTSCKICNNKKGNKTPEQANMILNIKPYKPTVSQFIRLKMKNHNFGNIF